MSFRKNLLANGSAFALAGAVAFAGLSDYTAQALLNFESGQAAMPALAARFLALFTTAPSSDAGTGGAEVSGGAYARVQVAGSVATNNTTASGSATLHFAATPSWIVAGMTITDTTTSGAVPSGTTVLSTTGTSVVMSANATGAGVGNGDSIVFCAWPAASASSGAEPATSPANVANGATVTFAQATANWGSVVAFGLYDAATSGNLISWDYLGAYKWAPFTCTSASPGVLTCDVASDAPANGASIVVTQKFGGALPTTGGSWAGILTTAGLSGATFTAGVNTTSIGGGSFRQVTQQSVPSGVTASFSGSTITLSAA
jgi:hypothetical protein